MSDEENDYKAEVDELYRNPRLARAFTRGQLLGVMGEFLMPFWRLAYDTMADGAPLPPVNALSLLAWQLQHSTSEPGLRTVITMDKTMGRSLMAMVALAPWLQARQLEPRDVHLVARNRLVGAELRRRYRRMKSLKHLGWMQGGVCPEFTEEAREAQRRSLVPGVVTWGTPLQQMGPRFLDDLIVCDPLPAAGVGAEGIVQLAYWLEALQKGSRRPDRMPTATVLTDLVSGGGLASLLADRGWRRVDIPRAAPSDLAMPVAELVELTWKKGSPVVLQPYTPYQLAEIRRSMKPAAFEASYT